MRYSDMEPPEVYETCYYGHTSKLVKKMDVRRRNQRGGSNPPAHNQSKRKT